MDLSGAWCQNDAVEEACRNEDVPAFREALKDYEREALEAVERVREESELREYRRPGRCTPGARGANEHRREAARALGEGDAR